jgi:carbon-monoxide dehydrogenase medium subunit
MKLAPSTYHDPVTISEATTLLAKLENARILAGGQSLMPMMNFRLATPDHLVDINGISELAGIECNDEELTIGAMTRQRDLEFSSEITAHMPILQEALRNVGHRQTRNRGTIGGSLCHLDPSAELVNIVALHDGGLHITAATGTRDTDLETFAAGTMTNSLQPDELLAAVTLPLWPRPHGYCFIETSRRRGDFAIAAVSVLLTLDPNGCIARAAIALSGLSTAPVRLTAVETMAAGQRPAHELFRAAAETAATLDAMEDPYASAAYRRHLARILTYRAMQTATKRAEDAR